MPRIAFILEAFYGDAIGGAERQVQMLAEALREQSWETCYICQRSDQKPKREVIDGMEVLALPPRKRRTSWLNYFELQRAMVASQADLFYQRVRHPYTGLGAYIARKLRRPFIFAAASVADLTRKEDLRRANYAGNPLEIFLHPCNRYFEDWGILHADHLILQTEDQLHLLKDNYQRSGSVIPNHIRIDESPQLSAPKVQEVVWISNIKHFKRPTLFLDLARRCGDLKANFIMIGSCPLRKIREKIDSAQRELPNFRYLGALNPKDSEARIAQATLLINTSEFEGFPNAFQQAWAHGVPTLSLGVDPDGVINREGLGASTSSLDEMEAWVRQLLANHPQRRLIAEKAIDYARKTYDLKILLPRYQVIFENLLRS